MEKFREVIVVDDTYSIEIYSGNDRFIVEALRNGDKWRDCTGDNLILAMAYRIMQLEEKAFMYDDLCK